MIGQRWLAPAIACAALLGAVCYLTASHSLNELIQLDGIDLDENALSKLNGNSGASNEPSYVHLSHESGKRIDRLLKKDEKGEIDGIALDSRAEAELGDSNVDAQQRHARHSSARKKNHVSRAQTLLDEGKEDLDSSNWQDAVKLFSKAETIWKRHGNDDYHWAASLKNDVLRAHPELKSQGHSPQQLSEHQREVKDAEKQLSSGHAFRSLYGLLRERQAARTGSSSMQSSPSSLLPSAPTSSSAVSLSQRSSGSPNAAAQRIDAATKSAIQTLEQQNKALLKHEEAAILYKAEEEKREALARNSHRAHRRQLRLAAAAKSQQPAQSLAAWQSAQGPAPGVSLAFRTSGPGQAQAQAPGREEALATIPASMEGPQVAMQAAGVPAHQPALYQYPPQQYQRQEPAVEQALAGTSGPAAKQGVPVINLNLPPGQTVPAGQYEMDGSLVQDLAGHWDFVGNLVPRGGHVLAQ